MTRLFRPLLPVLLALPLLAPLACDERPHGETDAGAVTKVCGPTNCGGCCSGGVCQTGRLVNACGAAGAVCSTCGAVEACTAGRCTTPADAGTTPDAGQTCRASNCAGCCGADGACHAADDAHCGLNGTACAACGATGICNRPSGKCLQPQTPCSPTTCDGCCDAQGRCVGKGAQTNSTCGLGGGTCAYCWATFGLYCDTAAGRCDIRTTQCGGVACAGCCDAAQVCQAGVTDSACGWSGGACEVCSGGLTCHDIPPEGTLARPCR